MSLSLRFVEKYRQLEGASVDGDEDTFESAAAALRQEGVALKTLAEMKQVRQKFTQCTYKANNLPKYELVLVLPFLIYPYLSTMCHHIL